MSQKALLTMRIMRIIKRVNKSNHHIEKGLKVKEALKAVADESEIPASTLNKWKYPRKSMAKNGHGKANNPIIQDTCDDSNTDDKEEKPETLMKPKTKRGGKRPPL